MSIQNLRLYQKETTKITQISMRIRMKIILIRISMEEAITTT